MQQCGWESKILTAQANTVGVYMLYTDTLTWRLSLTHTHWKKCENKLTLNPVLSKHSTQTR